jgi:DNA uptake protein ComE-like DNA-binding protein
MHLWVHPTVNVEQEKRLAAEWMKFKHDNMIMVDTSGLADEYRKKSERDPEPLPDKIDINTADSATLVRLKGIGPCQRIRYWYTGVRPAHSLL